LIRQGLYDSDTALNSHFQGIEGVPAEVEDEGGDFGVSDNTRYDGDRRYTFMAPDGGVNYAINAELTGDKNGDGISDFYICYFKYAPTAQDVGASYSED